MQRSSRRGFTLLEAMVSLVIFAMVTFALALALSVAMRAQSGSMRLRDQNGSRRAVFGVLDRDLRAAFATANGAPAERGNTSSNGIDARFVAASAKAPGGDVLELTTLSHRIDLDPSSTLPAPPQSDIAIVRYMYDADAGTIYRVVSTVPNAATIGAPTRTDAIAFNVAGFSLRFFDAANDAWRPDWDFETKNLSMRSGLPVAGRGQASLPAAVEVNLTINGADGAPQTLTTVVPIMAISPAYTPPARGKSETSGIGSNGPGVSVAPVTSGGTTSPTVPTSAPSGAAQ